MLAVQRPLRNTRIQSAAQQIAKQGVDVKLEETKLLRGIQAGSKFEVLCGMQL